MKRSLKDDGLKVLTLVGIMGALFIVCSHIEKKDKEIEKTDLKVYTVIGRKPLDGDEMTVTRILLDGDGNTNTVEKTCDMEMRFPHFDPRYEKILPNGAQRTNYELKQLGRLSTVKPGNSL